MVLKLEAIGDNMDALWRSQRASLNSVSPGLGDRFVGSVPGRQWCAEIVGRCGRYRWRRRFLDGQRDYSQANSVGSRGIFVYYVLREGAAYEILEPRSWGRSDRYFARVENGALVRMTDAELEQWLPKEA